MSQWLQQQDVVDENEKIQKLRFLSSSPSTSSQMLQLRFKTSSFSSEALTEEEDP